MPTVNHINERIKGVRESRRKMKGERWTIRGEKEGERTRVRRIGREKGKNI